MFCDRLQPGICLIGVGREYRQTDALPGTLSQRSCPAYASVMRFCPRWGGDGQKRWWWFRVPGFQLPERGVQSDIAFMTNLQPNGLLTLSRAVCSTMITKGYRLANCRELLNEQNIVITMCQWDYPQSWTCSVRWPTLINIFDNKIRWLAVPLSFCFR